MADFGNLIYAKTKKDYDDADKRGEITRPITDRPMSVRRSEFTATPQTPQNRSAE